MGYGPTNLSSSSNVAFSCSGKRSFEQLVLLLGESAYTLEGSACLPTPVLFTPGSPTFAMEVAFHLLSNKCNSVDIDQQQ